MKTFLYRIWGVYGVKSIKAWDFQHACNKVRKIHKTDEFTVELQMPARNWY